MSGQMRAAEPEPSGMRQPQPRPLKGWKQIADFLGCDQRTARRWHTERALPVYRGPGRGRGAVYAYRAELESWLRSGRSSTSLPAPANDRPAAVPASRRDFSRHGAIAAVVGAALVTAVWLMAKPEHARPPHQPVAAAQEHYLRATYLWEKRTGTNLEAALAEFQRAVDIDPEYAAAHTGIANTYNLLRQYGLMPAPEAYAAAAAAAARAIELEPGNAETQAALAFAEFYGLHKLTEGIQRFEHARRLDPNSPHIRHWLANALLHIGRFDEALAEIKVAQQLDPASRSVMASKGLALFYNGEVAAATALLTGLAADEPDYLAPHAYLCLIYLAQGDYPAFLQSLRMSGKLRGDNSRITVADAGEVGLRDGGVRRMLEAMIERERSELAAGASLHYNLARLQALSGDLPAMLASLSEAIAAHEDPLMGIAIDPAFRMVTARQEVRDMLTGAGLPVVLARVN